MELKNIVYINNLNLQIKFDDFEVSFWGTRMIRSRFALLNKTPEKLSEMAIKVHQIYVEEKLDVSSEEGLKVVETINRLYEKSDQTLAQSSFWTQCCVWIREKFSWGINYKDYFSQLLDSKRQRSHPENQQLSFPASNTRRKIENSSLRKPLLQSSSKSHSNLLETVKSDKKNVEWPPLALEHFNNGKLDESYQVIIRSNCSSEVRSSLVETIANASFQKRDYDAAYRFIKDMYVTDDARGRFVERLAEVRFKEGNYDAAYTFIKDVCVTYDARGRFLERLAEVRFKEGNYDAAYTFIKDVCVKDDARGRFVTQLIEICFKNKKHEELIKFIFDSSIKKAEQREFFIQFNTEIKKVVNFKELFILGMVKMISDKQFQLTGNEEDIEIERYYKFLENEGAVNRFIEQKVTVYFDQFINCVDVRDQVLQIEKKLSEKEFQEEFLTFIDRLFENS